MQETQQLAQKVGRQKACRVMRVSRSSLYRREHPKAVLIGPKLKPIHPRALSPQERQAVLDELISERFVDSSPAHVYAHLLEKGLYLCSFRTMYRILKEARATRERRNQRRNIKYTAPQLLATGANQVWSWDITKLLGVRKWEYFHLYVMLDIYSRYVIGWMVAERESGSLAEELIEASCSRQGIQPGQLTIHSDRGPAMISKSVVDLLDLLDIDKSVSRPYVSNDNPFIESHFRTMKYRPSFPRRFGSIQDARATLEPFFHWYNSEHRHSGIAYMSPETVHYGRAEALQVQRQEVLDKAFAAHPERFVKGRPKPVSLPEAVWINPPKPSDADSSKNPSERKEHMVTPFIA